MNRQLLLIFSAMVLIIAAIGFPIPPGTRSERCMNLSKFQVPGYPASWSERCQLSLRKELDIEPDAQTRKVYRSIIGG